MTQLVVVRAFGAYIVGAPITDPATVAAILAGPNEINVVPITDGGAAGGTVTPAQPSTVVPCVGVPSTALAALYGFAVDTTSTPNVLYKWSGTAWAALITAGLGGSAPVAIPVETILPLIAGTAQVGQTLAVSTGTWSGTPTSYAYQWYRGGVAISGATGATYAPVAGDVGAVLTCAVVATNAGGASLPALSLGTSAVVAAAPILQALGLSSLAATAGAAYSATITSRTSGSTLAATSSDGTALTIANGVLSGTFASAGTKSITLTETLAGATGSPKVTTLQVVVSAAAPVLQALGLSLNTAVAGSAWTSAITGETSGSSIAATSSDGTVLTVSGGQVSGTFSAAGTPTLTLTETLAGATGSPKSTQVTVTVSAAAQSAPAGLGADMTDAMNAAVLS